MEDLSTTRIPLFKKLDREIFTRIDKFKQTTNYNSVQDFYNGLDEEQQKLFKTAGIAIIFALPLMLLFFLNWQNGKLREELANKISVVEKSNEVLGLRRSLQMAGPALISDNPIDGQSMMNSRISNLFSASGIDLSKIKVSNYEGAPLSESIMQSESDFAFTGISTDELMNIFTLMIQREKFKIQSVDIKRNPETNLLEGKFHAVHFSNIQNAGEEE